MKNSPIKLRAVPRTAQCFLPCPWCGVGAATLLSAPQPQHCCRRALGCSGAATSPSMWGICSVCSWSHSKPGQCPWRAQAGSVASAGTPARAWVRGAAVPFSGAASAGRPGGTRVSRPRVQLTALAVAAGGWGWPFLWDSLQHFHPEGHGLLPAAPR